MSDQKIIPHTITQGGAVLLRSILASIGWYENEKASIVVNAASLLENELEGIKVPDEKDEDKLKEWENTEFKLNITDGQRTAIQTCIRFYLKKAAFRPSKHIALLLREFGIE